MPTNDKSRITRAGRDSPCPMWQFGFLLWNSLTISGPRGAAPDMTLLSDDKSALATIGCLLRNITIGGTTYDIVTSTQKPQVSKLDARHKLFTNL